MNSRTPNGPCVVTGQQPKDDAPLLWNKHHRNAPKEAVYIGRGSPWGNPFVIGIHGTRDEVVDRYEQSVLSNPEMIAEIKKHLRGKHLVCFCTPQRCHGEILLAIANEE